MSRSDWIYLGYLVAIVSFILALQFLSHPARARYGNWVGAFGMSVAIVATFFTAHLTNFASILIVMAIAAPVGAYAARAVKMTAMPEMVALFNGVGGGAAALIALADFHNTLPEPGRLSAKESVSVVALRADRQRLVLRQPDRLREAARADRRPADHLPGAAARRTWGCSPRWSRSGS